VVNVQLCGSWLPLALCGVFGGEKKYKSFENRKWTMELKDFFFKTFYYWTTALDLNLLSFHEFLDLFSLSN
jgi:hypothetical protein